MKISLFLLILLFLSGCTQQPRMSAWEHLQTALELDEASVLEFIALEHLPEIVAYDNTGALREAIYANPDAAVDWLMVNYRERIFSAIANDLPRELISPLIDRHGDIVLDQLYRKNPDLIIRAAVQFDPYGTFDRAFQYDPTGIIRRAIDQDPRYSAQYLRNYYGDIP